MQKIADKMVVVTLKLPAETVQLADLRARTRADLRKGIVTRSEILREIIERDLRPKKGRR